jgi:hypothetical protein
MSKNSNKKRERAGVATAAAPRRAAWLKPVMAALSACALLAAGAAATRWNPVRRAVGLHPLLESAAQQPQGNLALSKEYVYAGGRLSATEEATPTPAPTPAGPPPTDLLATATSASSVALTWVAPTTGTVAGYVVERRSGLSAQPVEIPTGSNAPTFNDSSAPPGDAAYLYRVKANFTNGGASVYGNTDLATTVVFTNDPLQVNVTLIKAAHLTELRRAVTAVRTLAGLGSVAWTYPDPVSSPAAQRRKIYYEDVKELRDGLDAALGPLNLLSAYPADPPLARGALIKAALFEQIRQRVR